MPLQQATFRAMGSPCELRLYCQDKAFQQALRLCREEVERLEAKYSRFRDDSLLSLINQSAGGPALELDPETSALIDYADQAHAQSQGLFDPSAGTLAQAWDFNTPRIPSPQELTPLIAQLGWQRIEWQRPRLRLPAGMQLDFGGFVKEYAVDAVAAKLLNAGFDAGLIDLGGDLHVLGPHADGSAWQIGLRNPRAPEKALQRVGVVHGAVASSGDYERYFIHQGRRYCHVLNPRSGQPVRGVAGVSVLAPQCLIAGTACTIAMLLEADKGKAWLDESGLSYLLATDEGVVHQNLS